MDPEKNILLAGNLKFWYQHQPRKQTFNQTLVPICVFNTVEGFWSYYQHFNRPSNFDDNTYLYLFHEDVKPVWQDPANLKGGAFVIRFEKAKCDKVCEDILLAFVGCCTKKCEEINGIRFKARKNMVVIEIWIRNIDKDDELEKLREWIISSTFLNPDTPVELITFHKE